MVSRGSRQRWGGIEPDGTPRIGERHPSTRVRRQPFTERGRHDDLGRDLDRRVVVSDLRRESGVDDASANLSARQVCRVVATLRVVS
jgi:hypothetical protein